MRFKETLEASQAIATIGAILVGGVWTYTVFVKERKQYPHANIEQRISHVALSQRANLLRVAVEVTNTGSSRLVIGKAIVRVQQVLPVLPCAPGETCADHEIDAALKKVERQADRFSWPLIAERSSSYDPPLDIEPQEKDFLEWEFAVPANVTVARIYTYFRNEQKSAEGNEVGWSMSSHHDFGGSKEGSSK